MLFCGRATEDTEDIQANSILDMLRFTSGNANFYFRTLRDHGVFVPHSTRVLVTAAGQYMEAAWNSCCTTFESLYYVYQSTCGPLAACISADSKEGFGMLAAAAKRRDWKLFRIRPKIHMGQHQSLDLLRGEELALNSLCFLTAP